MKDLSIGKADINKAGIVDKNRVENIGINIANAIEAKNPSTSIANINRVKNLSIVDANKNNNLCKGK